MECAGDEECSEGVQRLGFSLDFWLLTLERCWYKLALKILNGLEPEVRDLFKVSGLNLWSADTQKKQTSVGHQVKGDTHHLLL
ncbi:hypothetical protein PFLUV_G00112420 [Perca fluviatilis]|uniref:Uncharacterized protein n=1 Tax=Perca fluviatilis TaxID=8168 RepID=A0A6A5EV10_PERFL|nr:hypothetical protein PFLUV_G00112420 [Perca fluviatilis]